MDSDTLKTALISAGVGGTSSAVISLSIYLAKRRELAAKLRECKTPLCKKTVEDAMGELKSSALKLGLMSTAGSAAASAVAPSALKALTTPKEPKQKYFLLPKETEKPSLVAPVVPPAAIQEPPVVLKTSGIRRVTPDKGINYEALDNIVTPKPKPNFNITAQELKQPRKNDAIKA